MNRVASFKPEEESWMDDQFASGTHTCPEEISREAETVINVIETIIGI